MPERWAALEDAFDRLFPHESPRRKALHIVAIVLLVEGFSVIALFSYVGLAVGVVSLLIGLVILLLLRRGDSYLAEGGQTTGVRLVDSVETLLGGPTALMTMGVVLIAVVLAYNYTVSLRPELGDLDTITILFGATLVIHPVLSNKYKIESCFAVIYVGLVFLMLVVPQVALSLGGADGESSVGNLYVHYMLAAPFASILDAIGIPADSLADMVTITFQDGSVHTLRISAYCAGLYSFSIFLSAFISFVLVFERLQRRLLVIILALGVTIAYLGNLLRMVVVGVVGYYRGIEALHWAHENAGWVIFLLWSGLFWWLVLRYVSTHSSGPDVDGTEVN